MLAADLSSSLVKQKTALADPSSVRATGDFGATLAESLANAKPVAPAKEAGEKKPPSKSDSKIQPEQSSSDSATQTISVTTIPTPPLPVPLTPNPLQLPDVTFVPLKIDTPAATPEKTGSEPATLGCAATTTAPGANFPTTVAFAQNRLSLSDLKTASPQIAVPQSRMEDKGSSQITSRDHAATASQAPTAGDPPLAAQRSLNQIHGTDLTPVPLTVAPQFTTGVQLAAELVPRNESATKADLQLPAQPASNPLQPRDLRPLLQDTAVQAKTKDESGMRNPDVRTFPATVVGPAKPLTQPSITSAEKASFTVDAPQIVTAQWTVSELPGPVPQRTIVDTYKASGASAREVRAQPISTTTPVTFPKNAMDLPKAAGMFTPATVIQSIRTIVPAPVSQSVLTEMYKASSIATDKATLQSIGSAPDRAPQSPLVDALKATGIPPEQAPPHLGNTSVPGPVTQRALADVPQANSAPIQQVRSELFSTSAPDLPPQTPVVDVPKATPDLSQTAPPQPIGTSALDTVPQTSLVDVPQLNAAAAEQMQSLLPNLNATDPAAQSPLADIPKVTGAAYQERLTKPAVPSVSTLSYPSNSHNFKAIALNSEPKLPLASQAARASSPGAKDESLSMQNSPPAVATPTTPAASEAKLAGTVAAEPGGQALPQQSKVPEAGSDKTKHESAAAQTHEPHSAADAGVQTAEAIPSETPLANPGPKDGSEKKPSTSSLQSAPALSDVLAPAALTRDTGTTVVVPPGAVSPPPAHAASSEASEAPKYQQMPDAAPFGTSPPPAAHISTTPGGEMQMHVGIRTAAFGAVEIYTSVHQNQVGLTVRGEHGMAHWLGTEVQSIQSGLNDHHLNLTTMEMDKGGTGLQTGSGSQQQPQQRNFFAARNSQNNNLIRGRPDETKPIEAALPGLSWPGGSRVSIHV